ncbi:hypothetical protein [Pseudomarimonas arenosa]|uniref:Uncharacterized protein n=1 Tax=Pseudomarimonas arenosa TaxID=2774145 RepID=A0AAW3ZQ20_9GAMM|nr:hypothetical protein [Pseudomarimonas arenosa]MBD8528303.1 hypothetical protein [Pseudomarimonas arenosa]
MGKRVFCANRGGRRGCGATLRLYLAARLPRRQYGAPVLQRFVRALMAGADVAVAYLQATAAQSSRHGWRWLSRMYAHLTRWRVLLPGPDAQDAAPFASRSPRLRLLLPTLVALHRRLGDAFVTRFQLQQQASFLP